MVLNDDELKIILSWLGFKAHEVDIEATDIALLKRMEHAHPLELKSQFERYYDIYERLQN